MPQHECIDTDGSNEPIFQDPASMSSVPCMASVARIAETTDNGTDYSDAPVDEATAALIAHFADLVLEHQEGD